MFLLAEDIRLNKKQLRSIVNDPEKSAAAFNLVYVTDDQKGITRVKKGKTFVYFDGKKRVTSSQQLQRIKSLVIPPAWENVWICRLENGHLQATGTDAKKRKQYKYHLQWNALRNNTKFYRLYHFGQAIPAIRASIESDLALKGLPLRKVLAAVICIMERTSIRVGNELYEKLYGSFGLTTLKDKHVKVNGSELCFKFRGKKGVMHKITLKSRKLARIVKQCRDIPGKELFQYQDEEGRFQRIDSGLVNDYIREISGDDFTAKDFRTWAGTVQALMALKKYGDCSSKKDIRNCILNALDTVAAHLGNTRSVCKKYYIHPLVLSLFEKGKLKKYLRDFREDCEPFDLACEEKILLNILQKECGGARN